MMMITILITVKIPFFASYDRQPMTHHANACARPPVESILSRLVRSALVSAVASALATLMAGNAAMAQTAAAADAAQTSEPAARSPSDVAPTSVVTVVGTRKSVASAIDRKIRNATISDSLVAEDINQFPDKNVGEALSRITGVQLTRDFGEGSQISIRGVEPDLNRVLEEANSLRLATPEGPRGAPRDPRPLPPARTGDDGDLP